MYVPVCNVHIAMQYTSMLWIAISASYNDPFLSLPSFGFKVSFSFWYYYNAPVPFFPEFTWGIFILINFMFVLISDNFMFVLVSDKTHGISYVSLLELP